MAYNEKLANRAREIIPLTHTKVEEKAMFGGLCFMVNEKMCIGIEKERVMLRLDPAIYEEVMKKDGCQPMDFTGRVMKGYVFVDADVLNTKNNLVYWLSLALEYNKIVRKTLRAKPSKKKKK